MALHRRYLLFPKSETSAPTFARGQMKYSNTSSGRLPPSTALKSSGPIAIPRRAKSRRG